MKNLIYSIVGLLLLVSCEKAPKDYVTLKGKITNPNSDSLVIKGKDDYKKVIKLNADGTFEDTLKLLPTIIQCLMVKSMPVYILKMVLTSILH
ncbi:MAG: hypothetical protein R2821_13575 [Flavobacteriaceae bacterium]